MKKCNCSDRPLRILKSTNVMEDGVPYQELLFGCSNKNCSKYNVPVVKQKINLLDRETTIEEEIQG